MRLLDKRMTVITANVPSLLVAIGIAHSLHMIVRWRELQVRMADRTKAERAWQLVVELFWPCAYSAGTTMVGFASLYFAGSRPIIDFSLLMTFGAGLALLLSFIIIPGALAVRIHEVGEDGEQPPLPRPDDGLAGDDPLRVDAMDLGQAVGAPGVVCSWQATGQSPCDTRSGGWRTG